MSTLNLSPVLQVKAILYFVLKIYSTLYITFTPVTGLFFQSAKKKMVSNTKIEAVR